MSENRQNNKSLNILRIMLVACIVFYNVILFLATIALSKTPTFWVSYAFVMLVPLLLLALTFIKLPFTGGTNLTLSMPLMRIFWTYLSIEFIVGNIFIIFSKYNPLIAALILQVALLFVFAIVFLLVLAAAMKVSDDYQKQKKDVFNLNMSYLRVSEVASATNDLNLKNKLNQVAERIRFSDYNSYPENFELEKEIDITIDELESSENVDSSLQIAARLEKLLIRRESSCKYIKKMRG